MRKYSSEYAGKEGEREGKERSWEKERVRGKKEERGVEAGRKWGKLGRKGREEIGKGRE